MWLACLFRGFILCFWCIFTTEVFSAHTGAIQIRLLLLLLLLSGCCHMVLYVYKFLLTD